MTWFFAFLAVAFGATFQRITGIGFVLIAGPLLVISLDPHNGIILANILSVLLALTVLSRTYKDTAWSIVWRLLLGLTIGLPLGILVVRTLDSDALLLAVGSLTIIAVLLALFRWPMPFLSRRPGPIIAGAVSSFSTATAAVGGPALAVYGSATGMPMRTFIPTVQVVSLTSSTIAVVANAPFTLPLGLLLGSLGSVFVGMLLGSALGRFITPQRARLLALCLALAGAVVATTRGIIAILA